MTKQNATATLVKGLPVAYDTEQLLSDPAVPLRGIYLSETNTHKNTFTQTFKAA